MKLSTQSSVPVYTIAGASSARPLPEWLARKRKRSLKRDPEFANRVELLQDFEFEEASQCVRVSRDGDWVMSTGTYKPQIHTHYLPHLSLSYARHTNTVNQTFILLSDDYSKSLHLQTDRFLEFHTPGGLHYSTRIPRYGRDLVYNKRDAEVLVPSVGVNADGNGEVFRLNLEVGRFMKGFEVDVGGDDFTSMGGGALQGGIRTGAVNTAAVAEESHGLLAFGTSLGTVEFWDSRSRSRASILGPPSTPFTSDLENRPEITALAFHPSGLHLATGASNGLVHTYDMRSPVPLLKKDQGYDFPIQNLRYLSPPNEPEKILSSDKRIIKLWDAESGDPWTSVEPAVDVNHVEWVPDTGMFLTANEGRQQHSFFIPQLGPAPKWCAFLDNLVEEMAEDSTDPAAYSNPNALSTSTGAVYDNYKFLSTAQLRELNLDHLIGRTSLLRPYMHGYFVAQNLYEQARLISNPDLFAQQREQSIREKIEKERESRVRGNKKTAVKVNRRLAETLAAREEANERRKAQRVLKQGGDAPAEQLAEKEEPAADDGQAKPKGLMGDDRFSALFRDEDFEIDEASREFAMHNPSSVPTTSAQPKRPNGLTAVEAEELEPGAANSSDEDDSESEDDDAKAEATALRARQRAKNPTDADQDKRRIGSNNYRKAGHKPRMQVSSSQPKTKDRSAKPGRSFGDMAAQRGSSGRSTGGNGKARGGEVVGEKEVSFAPTKVQKKGKFGGKERGGGGMEMDRRNEGGWDRGKARRSASGNVFRQM